MEKQKDYSRQKRYYLKNKEKIAAKHRLYYERHKTSLNEQSKTYYQNLKQRPDYDQIRIQANDKKKVWWLKNRDDQNFRQKRRANGVAYYTRKRQEIIDRAKQYLKNLPEPSRKKIIALGTEWQRNSIKTLQRSYVRRLLKQNGINPDVLTNEEFELYKQYLINKRKIHEAEIYSRNEGHSRA